MAERAHGRYIREGKHVGCRGVDGRQVTDGKQKRYRHLQDSGKATGQNTAHCEEKGSSPSTNSLFRFFMKSFMREY